MNIISEINQNNFSLFTPKIDELKNKKLTHKLTSQELFEKIFKGGMPSVVTNEIDRNNYFSSYIKNRPN